MKKILLFLFMISLFGCSESEQEDLNFIVYTDAKISYGSDAPIEEINAKLGEELILSITLENNGEYHRPSTNNIMGCKWSTISNNLFLSQNELTDTYIVVKPLKVGRAEVKVELPDSNLKASCIINITYVDNDQRILYEFKEKVEKHNGTFIGEIKKSKYGLTSDNIFYSAVVDNKLLICSYDNYNGNLLNEWVSLDDFNIEQTIEVGYGEKATVKPNIFTPSEMSFNVNKSVLLIDFKESNNKYGYQCLFGINGNELKLLNQISVVQEGFPSISDPASKTIDWFDGFLIFQYSGVLNNSYILCYDKDLKLEYKSICSTYSSSSIVADVWKKEESIPVNQHIFLNYTLYSREAYYLVIRRRDLKTMKQDKSEFIDFEDILSNAKLNSLERYLKDGKVEFVLNFTLYDGSIKIKIVEINTDTLDYVVK